MSEGKGRAGGIQLKPQCIIISEPPLSLFRLPKPFRLCKSSVSREPVCGGQVGGGVFADDVAHQLWTFPASLHTTPFSSSSSLFFLFVHPPAHPPPAYPAHTSTHMQSRMHWDCSTGSSTARWRSPLRVWVPVLDECRGREQMSAWMRCMRKKKGGRME